MRLCEGMPGMQYEIAELFTEGALRGRLEALGIYPYTRVGIITKKKRGALIVWLRGTRLALGRKIADEIEIREAYDPWGAGDAQAAAQGAGAQGREVRKQGGLTTA